MERSWCVALILAAGLSACGGGSDDGASDFGPSLEGDRAQQAAAIAAVTLVEAFDRLIAARSGEMATTVGDELGRVRRAVRVACPLGGSVDGDCVEDGGRTTVVTDSLGCTALDDRTGVVTTVYGRLDVVYEARGICGIGVPERVPSRADLRNYREESRSDGALIRTTASERLRIVSRPETGGCSPNQGSVRFDGDLHIREPGVDLAMRLDDLDLTIASSGTPCDEAVVADGAVEVVDAVRGARFRVLADDLEVRRRVELDGAHEVSIDGEVDLSCVGPVRIETRRRLALAPACPLGGELSVALPDGASASAVFDRGTVRFDFGEDGIIELEAASCLSDDLASCM